MDMEPQTEDGKVLTELLTSWISKTPELAKDKIKRLFLMYASKILNEDSFIASLYGQGVVDEPPLEMVRYQQCPTPYVARESFQCSSKL